MNALSYVACLAASGATEKIDAEKKKAEEGNA